MLKTFQKKPVTYFEATSISTVLYSGTHSCFTYSRPSKERHHQTNQGQRWKDAKIMQCEEAMKL